MGEREVTTYETSQQCVHTGIHCLLIQPLWGRRMQRRVVFFVLGLYICVCVEESLGTTAVTIDECEFHILQVFPKVLLILWSSGAFSARGPSALWNFFTKEVFLELLCSVVHKLAFVHPTWLHCTHAKLEHCRTADLSFCWYKSFVPCDSSWCHLNVTWWQVVAFNVPIEYQE